MDVAGCDQLDVRVTANDLRERLAVLGRKADVVHGWYPGQQWRMVHRQEGGSVRVFGQGGGKPPLTLGIETATVAPWILGVERNEPDTAEIGGVAQIRSPRFRQPEVATQSRPVVVIAGQGENRGVQRLDQRMSLLVFLVGAGMGDVAGHEDRSRRIGEKFRYDGDGGLQCTRWTISPGRPEMAITQLHDRERHSATCSESRLRVATRPRVATAGRRIDAQLPGRVPYHSRRCYLFISSGRSGRRRRRADHASTNATPR